MLLYPGAFVVDRVQAVIEFDLQGRVLHANSNFLNLFGFELVDVIGQHHRLFCEAAYTRTPEYLMFWDRLGHGEFFAGEFRRVSRTGQDVWLQASYNPIFDAEGKPFKIVKFATDITQRMATEQHHDHGPDADAWPAPQGAAGGHG